MLIDGIHIPLTLPFHHDGGLYLSKLDHNVGRYSLTPAAGLVAFAPGMEAEALSDAEIADVLRVVSGAAAPEKVLIAAVPKSSVRGALAIAELAAMSRFDAIMLAAPALSVGLSDSELRLYFLAIADRSPLPVLLLSAKPQQLTLDQISEFARHPNIIGLYDDGLTPGRYRTIADATRDVNRSVPVTHLFAPATRRMRATAERAEVSSGLLSIDGVLSGAAAPISAQSLKLREKTVGFQTMLAGSPRDIVELLQAGATGAMLRISAFAPQASHEVYAAFKDGDPALSAERATRIVHADTALGDVGIAGIKHGCDWTGYFGGPPRLPRLPLNAVVKADLESALANIRN